MCVDKSSFQKSLVTKTDLQLSYPIGECIHHLHTYFLGLNMLNVKFPTASSNV